MEVRDGRRASLPKPLSVCRANARVCAAARTGTSAAGRAWSDSRARARTNSRALLSVERGASANWCGCRIGFELTPGSCGRIISPADWPERYSELCGRVARSVSRGWQ